MKLKTLLIVVFSVIVVCIPLYSNQHALGFSFFKKPSQLELPQFLDSLGFLESTNRYKPIPENKNYWGKYQIHPNTLKDIGIYTSKEEFLNDSILQERAIILLMRKNKLYCHDLIEKYEGKTVMGIKVTKSGILAAAHLGGQGNIRKFLKSGGERDFKDGNGVAISSYLKRFANYTIVL